MRSPLAGTADRSDRCPPSAAYEHARVDWSAYPLCSPSGGGHSADPGQKRVPGKGDNAKKGLTNRGPLQKGGQRRGHCPSTTLFYRAPCPRVLLMTRGHGAVLCYWKDMRVCSAPLPTLQD